jgi:DNA processing protein
MEGASTVRRGEPGYPEALLRLRPAPDALRLRGNLGSPSACRVAVVGARHTDEYGADLAEAIALGLARAGVSVVSGGAEGVDAAAHRGALEAGGHTVAVMGCGLDFVYPAGHRDLFARIVARGGALLSEYEDAVPPAEYTFPQRNRIVAALCRAVVVVRAGERSGALITAKWARRLGVPLLAVPGDVRSPLSAGTLALLRQGARPAASAEDVLASVGLPPLRVEPAPALEGDAAAVYRALSREPVHADAVARAAGLSSGPALAALLHLELEGLCEQRPGPLFRRRG